MYKENIIEYSFIIIRNVNDVRELGMAKLIIIFENISTNFLVI